MKKNITHTKTDSYRQPSATVSFIPILTLVAILFAVIRHFGSDALNGASQTSLLIATGICTAISMTFYKTKWSKIENAIIDNVKSVIVGVVILLLIGAIAGTWMLSGIVPTMIYYGLQIISPKFFLISTCLVCAVVSLITGSSWTTIATIGVAFLGIGTAQGFAPGWIAGAIISGAYFGDKISPLSDTTVLASSVTEVPLFKHIRYMLITTMPSLTIAIAIYLLKGLSCTAANSQEAMAVSESLRQTFNISPWLFAVPVLTGIMIAKRLPSLITLFCSAMLAALFMLFFQPHLLPQIGGENISTAVTGLKSFFISIFGSTALETGNAELDALVSTRGMAGMLNTIWLIICAMCFGGAMTGSGMLAKVTSIFTHRISSPTGTVGTTVVSGLFFNLTTADQYLSIILTGRLFKQMYADKGLESRLLSRTTEDSVTVTSVLIPWNSCGMTQATVLGVPTLVYLPYCFFNIISPIMSIIIAVSGYKIYKAVTNASADRVKPVSR